MKFEAVTPARIGKDVLAGSVVFLIAVPLCLGIALASNAPLISGLLTGIIGGLVVGVASGSNTSVSGPAAALAAIVAGELARLGSFSAFQTAVIVAGLVQLVLGAFRAGSIAAFFPSSVIKGLLTAIGVLLILKQIPHLLGHHADPTGDMSFHQPDDMNTFSGLVEMLDHVHLGPTLIGFGALTILVAWEFIKPLKKSKIPAPLIVVAFGVLAGELMRRAGGVWSLEPANYVRVPLIEGLGGLLNYFQAPDLMRLDDGTVWKSGITIALAASLATLLNVESADKLDPQRRRSPPNRELFAQGLGNITAGFIGAIPMTSEIVRSSININAGSATRLSTIVHGTLLLVSVTTFPQWLNLIPLSCLAALLLATGVKLAGPTVIRTMWQGGRYQFAPFIATVVAIVFTDLLTGVLLGLAVSVAFILNSNLRRPVRRVVEKHLGGDVVHVELANQVSFLNRAALSKVLDDVPANGHVLLDAQDTDYIDPDILALIQDYHERTAPARGIQVSMVGFRSKYQLKDQIQYLDYSTRELQGQLTPEQALQILKDGHERFRTGQRLSRDLTRQVQVTAQKQHPFAVILSCIDSRTPSELVFDLGLGDVFSIRIAGNIISRKVLASMEYACAVAGAKLVIVMGHTRCGAVTTAVQAVLGKPLPPAATECQHLGTIVGELRSSIDQVTQTNSFQATQELTEGVVTQVARSNVLQTARKIAEQSTTLNRLLQERRIAIVGALYDVTSGDMEFMTEVVTSPTK